MAANENKKEKKPNIFKRLGQKFKNLRSESKKVTWASPKSVFKSFGVVIVSVIAIAIVIGLLDLGLTALFNVLAENISIPFAE